MSHELFGIGILMGYDFTYPHKKVTRVESHHDLRDQLWSPQLEILHATTNIPGVCEYVYLWGYMRSQVYAKNLRDIHQLKAEIRQIIGENDRKCTRKRSPI